VQLVAQKQLVVRKQPLLCFNKKMLLLVEQEKLAGISIKIG
jgi:hypothetical protein